jgi:cysteine desulfurase
MNLPQDVADSFVRVSFGPHTSDAEVDRFLGEWRRIGDRVRTQAA